MTPSAERMVAVFDADDGRGGNLAPIVLDARGMDDAAMRAVAARHGLESAFVMPPADARNAVMQLRFFLPTGEVPMCGHATLGALWLAARTGRIPRGAVRIETAAGTIDACVPCDDDHIPVEIAQPAATIAEVDPVGAASVLSVLRLASSDLAPSAPAMLTASTSRAKTLVPLASVERLHALAPAFDAMRGCCDALDSTGLYPFAAVAGEPGVFEARQFPRASGYPEDAATGIAATALAFALLRWGRLPPDAPGIVVRQGRAMGRPSTLTVRFTREAPGAPPTGCRLAGRVREVPLPPA